VTESKPKEGAQAQKRLRIGVIQGVRVIEERVVPLSGTVTFGTAEGNTFTFAASDLPRKLTVFELSNGKYELLFDDAMQGRVEDPDGKKDFTTLKGTLQKQGKTYRAPLSSASKGRIRLSPEITVLFHFVDPPPPAAQEVMPPEVSEGLARSFEPIFTAVLTASFLVHFAFGIYVNVTEPPAPPSVDDLKALVERIQPPKVETKIPPPKPTPTEGTKPDGAGKPEPEAGGGKKEPAPAAGDGGDGGGKKEPAGGAKAGGSGVGNRDAIRQGIASKGILQLIGGRGAGGGGGAAGSVFGAASTITDDIGSALAGTAGVGIAGGAGGGDGITRRGSGGGVGGGDGSGGIGGAAVGIGDLQTSGGGVVDTGTKQATKVAARFQSEELEVEGKIDKKTVAATIRRRQEGFQGCYETALKANSKLAGKLVVEFTIAEDGRVSEARVVKDGVGSAEVSSCVLSLLKRLKFPPPEDGEVPITNAFVFQPG
jgi:TonB family protein